MDDKLKPCRKCGTDRPFRFFGDGRVVCRNRTCKCREANPYLWNRAWACLGPEEQQRLVKSQGVDHA